MSVRVSVNLFVTTMCWPVINDARLAYCMATICIDSRYLVLATVASNWEVLVSLQVLKGHPLAQC